MSMSTNLVTLDRCSHEFSNPETRLTHTALRKKEEQGLEQGRLQGGGVNTGLKKVLRT